MDFPLWATPDRRMRLVELYTLWFEGSCPLGESPCPIVERFHRAIEGKIGQPDGSFTWLMRAALATPGVLAQLPIPDLYHLAPWAAKELEALWKAEDREARSLDWEREKRRLHAAPQIRVRGPFDTIRREIYLSERPIFRLVGIGVGAFTFRRVAEVEVPGLKLTIWVDISGVKIGKNRLRKFTRYGKGDGAPPDIYDRIAQQVRSYLKG